MRVMLAAAAVCIFLIPALIAHAYQAENVTSGGTISGTVKYGGAPPSPEPLEITKDRDVCGTYVVYDPSLIVASDGGIANAVVTIADISKGEPMKPEAAVKFDQKGCEYVPHVLVFPAGSTIDIVNSDGILHNIHTESKINPVIDVAQPGFKREIQVTIAKPEIIKVSCDAHNWMQGWWYAAVNPYYALTGRDGSFTIANIPPGTYTLRVWQERLGVVTQKVTVGAGATVTANFTMKPGKGQD